MKNKRRIGFFLAFAGMLAALLFEPVNGRKRRGRIGRALGPVGRPLRTMRARLTGKEDGESGRGSGTRLIDRLHHVAVRSQGRIDLPNSELPAAPEAPAGAGAVQEDGGAPTAGGPKPRRRRQKEGPTK